LFSGVAAEVTPEEQFAAIEKGIGGRLGVAALDSGTGRRLAYRADELFAMCSTFKFLLAACILSRVDAGSEQIMRSISYTRKDLLEYAPVTRAHVQEGAMTVGELCGAAIGVSDNTAANLLLAQVGGPIVLTRFIRSLGNQVTRLDRTEPELNSALPDDPRDTTSPAAMLGSMEKLLVGNALSAASQAQLTAWLEQSTTGKKLLRAGFPADWRAGDKTGTGERGAMGDIGIFWPPRKKPILVAAYLMGGSASAEQREQAIAAVGRVVGQSS
jgi:beta-lactamase class A